MTELHMLAREVFPVIGHTWHGHLNFVGDSIKNIRGVTAKLSEQEETCSTGAHPRSVEEDSTIDKGTRSIRDQVMDFCVIFSFFLFSYAWGAFNWFGGSRLKDLRTKQEETRSAGQFSPPPPLFLNGVLALSIHACGGRLKDLRTKQEETRGAVLIISGFILVRRGHFLFMLVGSTVVRGPPLSARKQSEHCLLVTGKVFVIVPLFEFVRERVLGNAKDDDLKDGRLEFESGKWTLVVSVWMHIPPYFFSLSKARIKPIPTQAQFERKRNSNTVIGSSIVTYTYQRFLVHGNRPQGRRRAGAFSTAIRVEEASTRTWRFFFKKKLYCVALALVPFST
ncbi:hypothetical protein B0H16DRAFT_1465612 [Mycena metata]|uniref:Uncharacterized protein n=1 Tax=Mycena metata TaxID=1033252 RepID=A0AAD7MZ33_9AGAR|nr:hypothetical protein B0H16DRAFT_1465612 [Mycena metata]